MKKKEEEQELSFGQRFDAVTKPKRTTREGFNDKFIKTEKGNLARRGTVGARRAENREAARKRAQDAARKRREAKKK